MLTSKEFKISMSTEQRDNVVRLMKTTGIIDRADFFAALLESFEKPSEENKAQFSDVPISEYDGLSEQQLIENAKRKISESMFIHKAIVTEAKKIHRSGSNKTLAGTEKLRSSNDEIFQQIHELVQEQIKTNENASDWAKQRNINTSWIQCGGQEDEFGRSTHINLYNFKTVKQYLQMYGTEIDAHHTKFEISGTHNMKVPNELKRREKRRNAE